MFEPGLILEDRYKLVRPLGRSTTARRTWLASDLATSSHELVVMKFLVFTEMQWQNFKLFEREGQVLQHLNHPRIPRYRDYFEVEQLNNPASSLWVLVQEYVPGTSLQELLEKGTRFSEQRIYQIAEQILQILVYLHSLCPPVLHRDIKPSNLMLDQKSGKIWLIDFGAVQNQAAMINHSFTVVGTVGYAPLEQFWGKATAASDLYALGATLIHLLTGVAPSDLPQRKLRIQFRSCTTVNSRFIRWVEKLTEPALERRFNCAQDALTALEQAKVKPKTPSVSNKIQKSRTSWDVGSIAWYGWQCCYIAVGVGMIAHGTGHYQAAANFQYKAVSTIGKISQTIAKTTYSYSTYTAIPRTSYISTIQFNTSQGKSMAFAVPKACHGNDDPHACDGKEIKVFYDPDNPQLAMIEGGSSPLDRVIMKFWIGLFFMLFGIGSIHGSVSSSTSNRKQ